MGLAVVFAVIGFASAVAVFATYMGGSSHSVQQAGYAQLKGYVIPPTGLEQMSENVATESNSDNLELVCQNGSHSDFCFSG